MEISISRALVELKMINKKITDKIEGYQVAAAINSHTTDKDAVKEFTEKSSAKFDQISSLIERRSDLKSAIVNSNATTKVIVCNESMTVASAIERKTSIELEKTFLRHLKNKFYSVRKNVETQNAKVKEKAESQAKIAFDNEGEETKGYFEFVDTYYTKNKYDLVATNDIEVKMEKLQERIYDFESEVDSCLTESNSTIKVDV